GLEYHASRDIDHQVTHFGIDNVYWALGPISNSRIENFLRVRCQTHRRRTRNHRQIISVCDDSGYVDVRAHVSHKKIAKFARRQNLHYLVSPYRQLQWAKP